MGHKTLVGGTAYEVSGGKTLVGGTGYEIAKGRTLVGGTGYDVPFVSGIPLSSFAEGAIVYVNEQGAPAAFYVAKHNYESGLNGAGRTLLVRKENFGNLAWNATKSNAYPDSAIDKWLNDNYKGVLDAATQDAISSTVIYCTGRNSGSMLTISRAVFLLSGAELGFTPTYAKAEGSILPTANLLKGATAWLRTPQITGTLDKALYQIETGTYGSYVVTDKLGARPIFTLPSNALFDERTSVFNGGMA